MNNNNPKLSFITINYNNKIGLEKTINSILKFNFLNYEHIIIDGSSTDGSLDILKNYKNDKVNWISEKDNGIYDAMNKGIRLSKGEYIQFLNSGDYLINNYLLSITLSYFDLFFFDVLLSMDSSLVLYKKYKPNISFSYLNLENINHQSQIWRRDLIVSLNGFDLYYNLAGDMDLLIRALSKKIKYRHFNKPLVMYDLTGISSKIDIGIEYRKQKELSIIKNISYIPHTSFSDRLFFYSSTSIYYFSFSIENLMKIIIFLFKKYMRYIFLFFFQKNSL